jgi:hypothetical protein
MAFRETRRQLDGWNQKREHREVTRVGPCIDGRLVAKNWGAIWRIMALKLPRRGVFQRDFG